MSVLVPFLPVDATAPPDRLSTLLEQFRVQARLFHDGALCGRTTFAAEPGRAFLHVLRQGELRVEHPRDSGLPLAMHLTEPALLFYPRAQTHHFVNDERADFTCATLHFDGGVEHPLVAALPAFLCVPLGEVAGLQPTLDVLFAEAAQRRCGSRLLADRLFEVVLIQLLRWILDHPTRAGVPTGLLAALADARLARAIVALHQRPADEWTLPRMAAMAGMSRSAFAAAFKAAAGIGPAAYLAQWRLALASVRLRAGDPVKRVAAELGFASPSTLSKAFKQQYGASPRQWLGAT